MLLMLYNTLRSDLSSEEYHSMPDSFSSSQLKTMLEDPEKFYKDYVTRENPKKEASSLNVGTYFHTAILEPELLLVENAVFTGAKRIGKEWDKFRVDNVGKNIITSSELDNAEILINAVKNSKVAMAHIDGYEKELSAFIDVVVFGDEIFTTLPNGELVSLGRSGWITVEELQLEDIVEFGTKLRIKVRADAINRKTKIISDLKSTSGNCKNEYEMRSKIDSYSYDLSASLYLDIFSATTGDKFETFAWIFASKDFRNCKTWYASPKNVMIGRNKWKKAVLDLAYYINKDWVFEDTIGVLEPSFYQMEWIKE